MQGFMHFYFEKLIVARNRNWEFNRPLGDWRCKTHGVENLSGGFQLPNPPPPRRQLAPSL